MASYIVKRIILMIPTIFAISLVVFLILNFAPGKPGAQMTSGDSAQDATGSKREAYRVFKTQFNLDKPVLFNTYPDLKKEKIRGYLKDIANESGKVPIKNIIKAQDTLEDYGQFAIPALVEIMNTESDKKIRDTAVFTLYQNAPRPLREVYSGRIDEKTKKQNEEIDRENTELKSYKFPVGDGTSAESDKALEAEKLAVIAKWNEWYDGVKGRFTFTAGQKFSILLLDTRFAKYWWNLIHLDFGISHIDKQPVIKKILSKLKYSLSLSVPSVIIAYLISVPLGVFSAVKQNTAYDRYIAIVLFMLYSLPSFFVATLLLMYFSQGGNYFKWFPTGGYQGSNFAQMTTLEQIRDVLWHLVLPLVSLTYASFASLSRYARSGMLEVIRSDYIRTARAKGLSEFVVVVKHAMRNGMIPIVTLLGTILPVVIGGSVVIEYIFGIPGMGLLTITSIFNRDYNVIMGIELIAAFLVLIGILLSDITYAILDPRVSFK
ncbi:MAG: ABC transporter permease [Candidatus Eremiobacteraeota bacterium]|nr:ABC transporter permease [Candidatus Eremiobacteraeota bacterium]